MEWQYIGQVLSISFIPYSIENNLNSLNLAKASNPVVLKLNLFINFFTSLLKLKRDTAEGEAYITRSRIGNILSNGGSIDDAFDEIALFNQSITEF
jgi:hypothetical protein